MLRLKREDGIVCKRIVLLFVACATTNERSRALRLRVRLGVAGVVERLELLVPLGPPTEADDDMLAQRVEHVCILLVHY